MNVCMYVYICMNECMYVLVAAQRVGLPVTGPPSLVFDPPSILAHQPFLCLAHPVFCSQIMYCFN